MTHVVFWCKKSNLDHEIFLENWLFLKDSVMDPMHSFLQNWSHFNLVCTMNYIDKIRNFLATNYSMVIVGAAKLQDSVPLEWNIQIWYLASTMAEVDHHNIFLIYMFFHYNCTLFNLTFWRSPHSWYSIVITLNVRDIYTVHQTIKEILSKWKLPTCIIFSLPWASLRAGQNFINRVTIVLPI